MLHCESENAAMQPNPLPLASGIHRMSSIAPHRSGTPMSKAASITHTPSAAFFSRFIAALDRLLMANAQIAVRNNDLPYFGL
jgi:hypothetical protein